ncbi:MAG: InlB B-repeat-containing protein [Bacteroidales bacterium]|nr:InlB B-repeat-containing protein [Bacteroidales bacterium]
MKNKLAQYAMLLAASLSVASCSNDNDIYEPEAVSGISSNLEDMVFAATMENASNRLQKASLQMDDKENMLFSFTANDWVSVFSSSSKYRLDYVGLVDGKTSFAGKVGGDTYYALFPGQDDASISGNIITATIATEVDGSQYSNYAPGIISVAQASKKSPTLNFKNACSLLWIDGNIQQYKKIEVEANKSIAGKVTVEVSSSKDPVVSSGTANKITINNPSSSLVAVAPVSDANITVKFYRKDGSSFYTQYWNVNLERSHVALLSVADGHLAWFNIGVGGSSMPSLMVSENTEFVIPGSNGIVNPGFNFVGWKDANGTIYPEGSLYKMGTDELSFTAEWSNKLVLVYKIDGEKIQKHVLFDNGETFVLEAAPEREGYKFKGWLFNGKVISVGETIKPIGNTVVDAVYEPYQYTIVADANGGTFGDDYLTKKTTCLFNQTIDLGSVISYPVREDYDFGGYYDNPEFSGNKISVISNPTADINLYARWYKKYNVSYVYPNGDPVLKDGKPLVSEYSDNTYYIEVLNARDYIDYDKWFVPECVMKDADDNVYKPYSRVNVSVLDALKDIVIVISDAELN